MKVHKYEVGDKVKWWLKRANSDGDFADNKEVGPIFGTIKSVRDDIHEDVLRMLYPQKDNDLFLEDMPFYVVEADTNAGAFKGKVVDNNIPIPKFLLPESELFQ